MTVDGKLTLKRGLSSKIIMGLMDEESHYFLHKKRTEFDAIMVGSNTIKIDNSILTNRLAQRKESNSCDPMQRCIHIAGIECPEQGCADDHRGFRKSGSIKNSGHQG